MFYAVFLSVHLVPPSVSVGVPTDPRLRHVEGIHVSGIILQNNPKHDMVAFLPMTYMYKVIHHIIAHFTVPATLARLAVIVCKRAYYIIIVMSFFAVSVQRYAFQGEFRLLWNTLL